jgi:macrolide-specific efflux system membrane fusion protein
MSSTERAALLDAARAKGPEEMRRWEQFYRATPILAPIHGTVISRNVEPGQTFTSQDAIFVMSDQLTVKAQVDETDIAQIRLKQSAVVELDAYPGKPVAGAVEQIAYDAQTVSNVTTYEVDVLPERIPPFMRSGMTANVRFEVARVEHALVLPTNAVRRQGEGATVLVPNGNREPVERAIETGLSDGRRVEVLAGLAEGDTVLAPDLRTGERSGGGSPLTPFGRRR